MRKRGITLFLVFSFVFCPVLFAQNHVSVPVDHSVYYLLDLAETRGLCQPLPAVKPYTRVRIVEIINEILSAEPGRFGGLSASERDILENVRSEFKKAEAGLNLKEGMYRLETEGKKGVKFTGDLGIAMESLNSVAGYQEDKDSYFGTDTWGTVYAQGDVGENFSYGFNLSAGLMRAQRSYLGEYDTYATELTEKPDRWDGDVNQRVDIYSQPKAFFPYSYQKRWDGFMFGPGKISASGMETWPQSKFSIGPSMLGEISGTIWGDMLLLRFGRLQREWGAMTPGSSLVYNAVARPFTAIEALFNPVPWFSLSTLTGALEFDNSGGIEKAARTFQNMFSIGQVDFNYKNYLHIDFGSEAIWPKRFELGYLSPLQDNFLYQNFIGDFDNMAIHLNIKARYPGLGAIWISGFVDEMEVSSIKKLFSLDRNMFAYQFGLQGMIYGVPFASFSICYTKIEPYNYTHTRIFTPWHSGDIPMEYAYVNNAVSLGHYLPPNSDEIKVRVDIPIRYRLATHFQYQLIRHGADYGPQQVDGSSLVSELDPSGRGSKVSLTKKFLKDGAYQWMHIIKVGGEYRLGSFPLTIYGDAGIAYSYFTTISDTTYKEYHPEPDNPDRVPYPWTPPAGDYHSSTAYILTVGIRVFK